MPKAYSYIRFSRPEQMRGDSLRRQTEDAEKWAAEHGLEIDEQLTDLGVSAFRGKNAEEGALAEFLRLATAGQIEPDSVLIVENLDRLSRQKILPAFRLVISILEAGVRIVTLADGYEYTEESANDNPLQLIVSLTILTRAHDESRIKSERVGKAWAKKREAAAERPLTSKCPEWLRLEGGLERGRFRVIPERATAVRRVYEETAQGFGKRLVAARLNADGVPAFRSKSGWHPSYVMKLLDSRAVLGEYQPHRMKEGKRVPVGDPVAGYYPAVVDENLYWRAQAARERRQKVPGRRGEGVTNLLQGLVKCRDCGASMTLLNKGKPPKGARYLACSNNLRSAGCSNSRRWRYDLVERTALERVTEIDLSAALEPGQDLSDAHLEELRGRLSEAEQRRAKWAALVDTGDELAVDRFREAAADLKAIRKSLREAEKAERQEAADGALPGRLETIRQLRDALATAEGQERQNLRARLAEEFRKVLERVDFAEHSVVARYQQGRQPKKTMFRPYPASVILLDAHPDSVAAKAAEAEAAEAQEAEDAKRAARSLARFRRRRTATAK